MNARPVAVVAVVACALSLTACGAGGAAGSGPNANGPPGVPRVMASELDALLADVPARAAKLGAGPMSMVASGATEQQERLGGFVVVPSGLCLLAYARASSSIEDLDVAAFADEGNPLASDDAPDAHPTILVCPPHPERVYVSALTATGAGLVALGVQFVPPERAADVGHILGARGTRFATPDAWLGLDDHVRTHREGLGGKWEEFRRVAVSVDARVPAHVAFPLEAEGCTDALIVPDDDVAVLEIEAVDDAGRVLARAGGGPRDRSLTVCSSMAFGGSLVVRPHIGQGLVAIVLARARGEVAHDLSVRPDVAWASGSLPLEAAKGVRNSELAKSGYAPPESTHTGVLAIGRLLELPLDLGTPGTPKEACARVDVVAGAPLALLHAEVWDDKGALVTGGEGAGSVTLFACSRGKARLELEARGRPGPYASLVRAEPWKDPAFLAHPLAASRMLARTATGPSVLLEGTALPVRVVTLDAGHSLAWDESIPAGKCLRVGAGAEGEGTGLLGRLIERGSGDEIDRSHAAHAIGLTGCATPGAPRSVHVEMRVTAGKLDVVVGERLVD